MTTRLAPRMGIPQRFGPLLLFALLFVAPRLALAAPHDVCLYFDIGGQFWDASPYNGEEFKEEFGRHESNKSYPAQRWLAQVLDNNGDVLFGWEPLDGNGCATVDVTDPSTAHVIRWVRWAHWETTGNHVVSYDCESDMSTCNLTDLPTARSFTPGASSVSEVIVGYGSKPTEERRLPRDMILWGTSFAEERMVSLGQNTMTDTRSYATYDEGGVMGSTGVLPGESTAAGYLIGNQPGFTVQSDSYHKKFTIAHEYGHISTIAGLVYQPAWTINYCYDKDTYPVVMSCPSTHLVKSAEWGAASAIEGLATWFAVAVWHDVDLYPHPNSPNDFQTYDVSSSETTSDVYPIPRPEPLCNDDGEAPELWCPPGVSNEWDWTSLFQVMRRDSGISLKKTFQLLAVTYGLGTWNAGSPNRDFYDEVDLAAQMTFSASEYAVWQTASEYWVVHE